MNEIQNNLNKTLNSFEEALNIAGYVPVVSSLSGLVRISLGELEIVGSIVAAALIATRSFFFVNASDRERESNKAFEIFIDYSLHGCANIIRGIIERIPFASLVTCLPYDRLLQGRFVYPITDEPYLQWKESFNSPFRESMYWSVN
jgi:hypothetical protein